MPVDANITFGVEQSVYFLDGRASGGRIRSPEIIELVLNFGLLQMDQLVSRRKPKGTGTLTTFDFSFH